MFRVSFTQAAKAELIEAQDWYEAEVTGLGQRFLAAINALSTRLIDNPKQFPVVLANIRRASLIGFPYSLLFVIENDFDLLVIACFHASRDPKKWQARA